jgi:hypothetical protein
VCKSSVLSVLLCLGFLSASTDASAQLLPTDRTTIWNPGLNSVGGIPNRTTVCATVNASTYGNGASDAFAGIQAAIDGCPVGQVVQLSAGTFTLNSRFLLINKGITLRGSFPVGSTILQKTNGAIAGVDHHGEDDQPIVIVGPERYSNVNNASSVNLSADGLKGSRSVTVANGSGLSAGQFVLLDADEFDAGAWLPLPFRNPNNGVSSLASSIWASDRVVYMLHNPPEVGVDDPFPASLGWFSRTGRPVAEVKLIASVSGNTITFTSPLHITYPVSKTSQLTRYLDVHVQYAGVENVKMIGASDGCLRFEASAFSWAKNVEITVWYGEGVDIDNSFGIELRDSYIHDAALSNQGGIAYAISLAAGGSEALIENNIVLGTDKVIVARASGAGSVVAYNYMDDGFLLSAPTFAEVGLNGSHMVGSHHMLFEGNESFNYDSDSTHGSAIYMTIFRNHLTGFRRDYPTSQNARTAGLNFGSWWHSFAGNVQGIPGGMTGWGYEETYPWTTNFIWELGYQSGEWEQSADPMVLSTVLRGGNYDYLTNLVHWETITAQALPNSMYLSGKPAFFGSYTWPWVDGPGPTKLFTLPARARYDAGTPFAPSPGGTPPAPPTNLHIVQ